MKLIYPAISAVLVGPSVAKIKTTDLSKTIYSTFAFGESWSKFQKSIEKAKKSKKYEPKAAQFYVEGQEEAGLDNAGKKQPTNSILNVVHEKNLDQFTKDEVAKFFKAMDSDKNEKLSRMELLWWVFMSLANDPNEFPTGFLEYNFSQADKTKDGTLALSELWDFDLETAEDKGIYILHTQKYYNRDTARWIAANYDFDVRFKTLKKNDEKKYNELSFQLTKSAYLLYNKMFINRYALKLWMEDAMAKIDKDEDGKVERQENLVRDWGSAPTGIAGYYLDLYHKYSTTKRGEAAKHKTYDAEGNEVDLSKRKQMIGQREMTPKMIEQLKDFAREEYALFESMDVDRNGYLEGQELWFWLKPEYFNEASNMIEGIYVELEKEHEDEIEIKRVFDLVWEDDGGDLKSEVKVEL